MESCLMNYFVLNTELKNTCEYNPDFFESTPSVYEVIRVEKGTPLFLEDHIQRFFKSAGLLGKEAPVTNKQICSRVKAVIETNHLVNGLIKFLFMNHPEAGLLFAAWVTPFYFPSDETYAKGVKMVSLHECRENPNAKLSHQAVRKQADEIIKREKVYEVMLVNQNNMITEGSRANLFFVLGGILFTAHHNLVLEGITRTKIIELALNAGIDVCESEFKTDELPDFDAAFLTGTTPKILPIRKIDLHKFNINHSVIKQLSQSYNRLIADYILGFSW